MDTETTKRLLDIANVVVGAMLGFGSAVGAETIKGRRRTKAMKRAIRRELRDTAHRFLGLVYTFSQRHGQFKRDRLIWLRDQFRRYSGANPSQNSLAALDGLLAQTDEQIEEINRHFQATMPPQFTPREEPAFVAASVADVHDLGPEYASRVLDILAHIRMLNDGRENGLFHTRLTFTPGLSAENLASARRGIDDAEKSMLHRAMIVVDKITLLEDMYPDK
jgi:hypothetical protein